MTLTIYKELEQGSEEWLQARCGLVTASTIGKLITPTMKVANNETSRSLINALTAERITGKVEYTPPTFDMHRGIISEPYARDLYALWYGADEGVEEIGFATTTLNRQTLGASPDGLVGEDGGIEIKSRKTAIQMKTILTDQVPAENLAQIHTCMLVLERQWWDYVSYCEGLPLHVIRVYRDPAWDGVIGLALREAEHQIGQNILLYRDRTADAPIATRIENPLDAEIEIA